MPKHTDEDVNKSRGSNVLNEENTSGGVLSAYERWELPSMEVEDENANNVFITTRSKLPPVAIEDEEEVVPLTADDVEAIRQAAYDEGYSQGNSTGHAEGLKKGYDEGYQSGSSDIRAMLTRLSQICRVLLDTVPSQDDEIETALMELVKSICGRVVQRELQLDSTSLRLIINEALDCLQSGAHRLRIHLNPEDTEFIRKTLEDMEGHEFTWQLLPHATISPGGCIVETDKSMIDARSEKRLADIIEQVYSKEKEALMEGDRSKSGGLGQLMAEVETFDEFERHAETESPLIAPPEETIDNADASVDVAVSVDVDVDVEKNTDVDGDSE